MFCFNETATREIYTYRPTLSPQDALPICARGRRRHAVRRHGGGVSRPVARDAGLVPLAERGARHRARLCQKAGQERPRTARAISAAAPPRRPHPSRDGRTGAVRSEEHTSELQSLMRLSYAVFCLKKKTQKNTTRINNNH